MIYYCYTCGAANEIVNQCGCDPANMPTKLPVWSIEMTYYRTPLNDAAVHGRQFNLAVIAHTTIDGEPEEVFLSVNLCHGQKLQSQDLREGEFFFDVNNHRARFVEFFDRGWIAATGQLGQSGHVTYPVVRLTTSAPVKG